MGYTPKPLKPYTPVPLKPYLPAPLKPYLPASRKRFLPKPDKKQIGTPLMEGELEVLKAIGKAGGAATVLVLSRTLGKGQMRVSLDCQVLAEADYINMFESGFCRMRPLGWQELEKDGERYAGAAYPDSEVSYVELQVLQAVAKVGGAMPLFTLCEHVEMRRREMSILCNELGQDNYIDLFHSQLIRLTRLGWQELDKRGWKKEEKEATAQQLKCPYYGGSNQSGATFCVYCKRWLASEQKTYTLPCFLWFFHLHDLN